MSRVAYAASKREFLADWEQNRFLDRMAEGAQMARIAASPSERHSWEANAAKVSNLLRTADVPDDIHVVFEYKSPLAGRVDCMLFGFGGDGKRHIVHIELKQWSNDTVTQLYDTGVFRVSAMVGGAYRVLPHPSQQALNYQSNMLNFVAAAARPNTELNGRAYCFNYKFGGHPRDLFSPQYQPILTRCPLHGGDQVGDLARTLHDLLAGGKGAAIFREFVASPCRPTKNLMDAAANMFRGQEEFVLVDDQITSANAIFGMVAKALANPAKKLALIVRGGPGTGKTVIALHVIAELAAKHPDVCAFFTTRSKALRNTLRDKLGSVATGGATTAAGLVRNIYDFRPANFAEGEVDVLLVDEAHRIRRSSNYMADQSLDNQTFLPQVLSLLYCAKVCVFFIDDKQGVSPEEIGTSSSIQDAAEHYAEQIARAKSDFVAELAKTRAKLVRAQSDLEALSSHPSTPTSVSRLQKRIQNLQRDLDKAPWLHAVKSSVGETEVLSIELTSQFRCNGSDNYLDWLDRVIYEDEESVHASGIRFGDEYEFGICDSPAALEAKIRSLNAPAQNPAQVARLAAGYCWAWSTQLQPNGDLCRDVRIGNWSMPWETNNVQAQGLFASRYAPSADLWASHPQGINQVGCIFSAQGFEVDYVGVILGHDIRFDPGTRRIVAVPGHTHGVRANDPDLDIHVKNIYRVLLSRGRLGCFVYCCDQALADYLASLAPAFAAERLAVPTEPPSANPAILPFVAMARRFVDCLPFYGLQAACGAFGEGEAVECEGWVPVSSIAGLGPLNRNMFVIRASGHSMEPRIPDGALCVFRANPAGSRQGKIVLAQHRDTADSDTGGAFSIKRYESRKRHFEDGSWEHEEILLCPLNPAYAPIRLDSGDAESFRIVAEFVALVPPVQ